MIKNQGQKEIEAVLQEEDKKKDTELTLDVK